MNIEKLTEKRDQLDAQIQLKEARLKQKKRKDETRRKIIIGALMINKYEQEGKWNELLAWLETKLDRKLDRKLFGFTVKDDCKQQARIG